ncbi:MAG TPA: 16S rRNA (guanine(527)-N(7))-methyltransferase RsmG [Solirubrobacteraceae bacterium]
MATVLDLLADEAASVSSVRERGAAMRVHVEDSLDGLRVAQLREARRIADIGAGAGFPGLVLAAALPEARVYLVESVGRKCAFIDRAAAAAGLDNADVVCARAEEWPGQVDAVTARALAPLNILVEYAAPLLELGGALVAWKGRPDLAEEADGAAAAAVVGLELADVVEIEARQGADERRLYVYLKVLETPARFPRRAGMARKRPIRA